MPGPEGGVEHRRLHVDRLQPTQEDGVVHLARDPSQDEPLHRAIEASRFVRVHPAREGGDAPPGQLATLVDQEPEEFAARADFVVFTRFFRSLLVLLC